MRRDDQRVSLSGQPPLRQRPGDEDAQRALRSARAPAMMSPRVESLSSLRSSIAIASALARAGAALGLAASTWGAASRSEEHTSELQSLMRISYAVFCLKKKNQKQNNSFHHRPQTEHNIHRNN